MKDFLQTQLPIIVLFVSAILLLIMFCIWIGVWSRRTNTYCQKLPHNLAQGVIDIEGKSVTIYDLSKNKVNEPKTYELDDFIYMLSINPDSKLFRELLKLINNGNPHKKIIEKLKTVPHSFPMLIEYEPKYRSLSIIGVNHYDEIENEIIFQIENNPFLVKKKKVNIEMDFFEKSIQPITDSEIYSNLIKISKKFLSKGANIVKVSSKYKFIDSQREYMMHVIRINILKNELEKQNVKSFIGRDGSLYAIAPNDRKKSMYSVQRSWSQRINNIFIRQKRTGYLDFDVESFNIDTVITQSRDSRSINEALIYLNLISYNKRNDFEFELDELMFEAKSINTSADELLKRLKEKNGPIRSTEYEIVERGIKSIREVYIDIAREILDPINKFSFRHKKQILELLLAAANRESNKHKTQIVTITIDMLHILEVSKYIETEKIRPNLHIVINERKRVMQFKEQLIATSKLLSENEIRTMQYITTDNGGHIDIYRIFKSEYILIAKGLFENSTISDNIKINVKNIESIKERETKIINIK